MVGRRRRAAVRGDGGAARPPLAPVSGGEPQREPTVDDRGEPSGTVVERQFEAHADFWRDVYLDPGLNGLIYRRRMEVALNWIDGLRLSHGAGALDAGCGAGMLAIELARQGLSVAASDASAAMISLTREAVAAARPAVDVTPVQADVERLPFADGEFALVAALGLLPWLTDSGRAVAELARVLAPGGWLLLTADNRARLNFLVEPRENPLLTPLKLGRRAARRAVGRPVAAARCHLHRPSEVDRLIRAAGLEPIRRATVGFGQFTFMGRGILADRLAIGLHERLERASAGSPLLRRTGWHYVVLARAPAG